jgi:uncharacterized protein YndB with AHSA1/START domain
MTETSTVPFDRRWTVNANASIEITAPREHVFNLLTDPELIPTWWPIIRRFEPRPGGRFEIGADGWIIEGQVTTMRRPRTLAYTWRCAEHPPGRVPVSGVTNVRFELDQGERTTMVRVSHGTFEETEQARTHARVWRYYLGRLKDVAEE